VRRERARAEAVIWLATEAVVAWIALGLSVLAGALVVVGSDGWWSVGVISLVLWGVALGLRRRRLGRIELFDDH
jgi:hypothetical protein